MSKLPSRLGLLSILTISLLSGKTTANECPVYDTKQSDGEGFCNAEALGNAV